MDEYVCDYIGPDMNYARTRQPIREKRGLNLSLKCRKFLSGVNFRTQQFWMVICVLYFL
jgi:hypothetical protein